ncbi:MAG: chemotaxis protein CheW [Thermacetogeniaceae bacterium]|nr:chemotaxis protein CheW [Thermoanaerobacterales bacterium]NLN20670.1 purine-binding chemotaxis protein CheW [Syntrophomonadaceae bacterium]
MVNQEPGSYTSERRQVVHFIIGSDNYGLEVEKVQEIIRPLPVTRVPFAPAFIEGVINLRGCIIPVIKLDDLLGKQLSENDGYTRVVIAHFQEITVGLKVDSVKGVVYLDIDFADPILKQAQIKTRYISGIGKLNDQLILLLDLASLLDDAKLNKQEEKC